MNQEDRERIIKLMGEMQCPKDFKCAESGFTKLCKSKDVGLDSFLECLEDHPWHCTFAVAFANAYYCDCPLRVYLAKKLNK